VKSRLKVVSLIKITTRDPATAEKIGVESLDKCASSLADSSITVSSAHTPPKAPDLEGSNINSQGSHASAGAPQIKEENEDPSSLLSIGTAGSDGTSQSDDTTGKAKAAALVGKYECRVGRQSLQVFCKVGISIFIVSVSNGSDLDFIFRLYREVEQLYWCIWHRATIQLFSFGNMADNSPG
jgi:hypothetical protein